MQGAYSKIDIYIEHLNAQAEYVEKLPSGFHSTKGVGKTEPDPAKFEELDGAKVISFSLFLSLSLTLSTSLSISPSYFVFLYLSYSFSASRHLFLFFLVFFLYGVVRIPQDKGCGQN